MQLKSNYTALKKQFKTCQNDKTYSSIPIIELQQSKKEDFLKKLKKSEEDYKEGRIYSAEEVFKELRREFKY